MNYEQQYVNAPQCVDPLQYACAQQGPYPPQNPYTPQDPYAQQNFYAQQDPYVQHNPHAQHNPYAQQDPYAQQNPYAQQDPYAQQNPYAQQDPYAQQNLYAQQNPYAQPWEAVAQPGAVPGAHSGNPLAAWGDTDPVWESFDLESLPELPGDAPGQQAQEAVLEEDKPDTPAKKILRIASNVVFVLICVVLVGGSALFALNKDPNKSYFNTGFRTYNVLTDSMRPRADGTSPPGGFIKGDTIVVKMCKPEEVVAGDIITFNPNPNEPESELYLTHRVVRVLDELGGKEGIFLVTKGDSNNSEDPPISGKSVVGKKVATIPKMGAVLQSVRNNFVVSIIIIVGTMCTIFMFQWYFAKPKKRLPEQEGTAGEPSVDTVRLSGKRRFV